MTHIAKNYEQPWPLCWQLMQWDLVLWASLAKNNTRIQVTWNEATLRHQIAPADFQQSIQEFKQALTQQLGHRLNWRIDTQSQQGTHVIEVSATNAATDVAS
jgi:hypothetical protein